MIFMRKRRQPPSSPGAPGQRRRNLRRYLRKRHLHLKHRQREVVRMQELKEAETSTPDTKSCEDEPPTPPKKGQ
ncbi:hypothetical protein ASALC70_00909 [Alcanivorax sp. ALC70]|nr:hypothetical protein ASALC70_00909 [Alcanivorax sp. ALC70]